MTDAHDNSPSDAAKTDWRDTVFLPKTDFPMKAGLPQKEPGILAKWQGQDFYRRLRDARKGREQFILHDGPPYANGDMHIGHALNHILKDMVVRTQSLLGKDAPYVPGWDCHGLPIEWKVEEQYRKKKLNKDEVPANEFRAECRAYAQGWVDVQREQLKRLGINADWDNPYLTMHFDAESVIVSELLKFAESCQLYRGAKPVMWSPVEKTALAEAEVEYEDITSTQIDVAFEIVESPIAELVGAYAVIWTTTPWTIPVNQAIAYGPDVEYVHVGFEPETEGSKHQLEVYRRLKAAGLDWHGKGFLIATPLVQSVLARLNGQAALVDLSDLGLGRAEYYVHPWQADGEPATIKGSDLAGTMVRHPMAKLFSGESRSPERSSDADGAELDPGVRRGTFDTNSPLAEFFTRLRPMLPGDFVTTDSGTGLVHMAPDHGEDDFDLCKAQTPPIQPVFAVGPDGRYRDDWPWLGGHPWSVIDKKLNAPDGPICEALREVGALLSARNDESTKHSYPHSWRSKAKVIYRCTPQWFVPMDKPLKPLPSKGGVGVGEPSGSLALSPTPSPSLGREGDLVTLRETALAAISATRWVPEKGENRIRSMVEGRPDWVLSRQRAWGVPITLFVHRKTGEYLNDLAVNSRIIAGIKQSGVDAWCDERAAEYLGDAYDLADYERVTDILDVWFDSGSTHAFVLESGKWPDLLRPEGWVGPRADLYLEGSDQHRGWFQSSLLESCGTRGHAPYKAVLTHGFTMDAKGMKMSKSLGNTINPIKLMETNGADILRLWALSVDFTEDHRIGDEILKGVSDQYRKLRNTFRYLLGALDGFSEAERVSDVAAMPELERYVLHLLADLDAKLRVAVDDFDFNSYVRLLSDFANNDLSAFFFDIRKDCLYCDAADDPKRMAYRTVLDTLFHALVRYAAPVLVFTAEEVWGTRFPDGDSVHLLEWPVLPLTLDTATPDRHSREGGNPSGDDAAGQGPVMDPRLRGGDEELVERWGHIRTLREAAQMAMEQLRQWKRIGSSLQTNLWLQSRPTDLAFLTDVDLAEVFISGPVVVGESCWDHSGHAMTSWLEDLHGNGELVEAVVHVDVTTHHKCGRCWRHLPEVAADGDLCGRCESVVNG